MGGQAQNDREAVGPLLRTARHQAGLDLEAAAALTGISGSHLAAVERGQYVPGERTAELLVDVLGLDEQERRLLALAREARRAAHPWRRPFKPERLRGRAA